ncbi:hypothetical protein MNV49_000307 [Pseudohyphozyma bogoriensis]|nr:hypothetical protein MNV49_000307 [Pseudohyphozyma bogoriensis]
MSLAAPEDNYLPNVVANAQSLYYVKSTSSSISGAVAGVLGLTNLSGFLFYLVSSVAVGIVFAALNCKGRPAAYFANKSREVVLGGLLDNAFSFVLFWTLFYALVHIYD